MVHSVIVQALINQINQQDGWKERFQTAVTECIAQAPLYMKKYEIRSLDDYFNYMDSLLTWIPSEIATATQQLERLRIFYFLFEQNAVRDLQTEVTPETTHIPLSWMSEWLVSYARSMGEFLDSPDSLTSESLETFFACPKHRLQDYIIPEQGWNCFNDFFARRIRPELRPIAEPEDPRVIVSPADSAFRGSWPICGDEGTVTFKGISWRISDLLKDSVYGEYFRGGTFVHSILFPWNYHRTHTPLGGTVLEARVIHAQAMLDAIVVDGRPKANPDTEEGYQWCQTRGLIVLDTPIGKVAVLPVGMGHISSVKLSVESGQALRKGDELAYFQYGGSDIALIFEKASDFSLTAVEDGDHPLAQYKVGEKVGSASVIRDAETTQCHL
jgi:phosphatidylserine decarboxylase precursor